MNLWVLVSSTKVDLNTFGDIEGNLTLQVQVPPEMKSTSFSTLMSLVAMVQNALRCLKLVMDLVCTRDSSASTPAHLPMLSASFALLSRIPRFSSFHPHVYV